MQKDEIIIREFVKTIKESTIDVKGDPETLDRVLAQLEKKKRGKRFFLFVLGTVLTGICFIALNGYLGKNKQGSYTGMVPTSEHINLNYTYNGNTTTDQHEEKMMVPVKKKTQQTVVKKQPKEAVNNMVRYTFNNHQVDVVVDGKLEFIQINVFGVDGAEEDVLSIMEKLKKSYQNNELYVDSINHK
jgi:hypothetical protein